jgi:phage major head subunit gpT-like protein
MIIGLRPSLDDIYIMASAAYRSGFKMATPTWQAFAMTVPSGGRENHYPWLGVAPKLREWLGDRVVKNLEAHDYSIVNRKYETTVAVKREDIDDDLTGTMRPVFERMGQSAAQHPDELVYAQLISGGTELGYDGQPFFDATHPTRGIPAGQANEDTGGSGPFWYLMDTRSPIKPLVFQTRDAYDFQAITDPQSDNMFKRDEFLWGVRARVNVGFGLWQHAFRSNQAMTEANLDAARVAMESLRNDSGQPMGITPNMIVVPPALRLSATKLVGNELAAGGETNVFKGAFDVLVSPQLPNT